MDEPLFEKSHFKMKTQHSADLHVFSYAIVVLVGATLALSADSLSLRTVCSLPWR
jgi:hypothetical protein